MPTTAPTTAPATHQFIKAIVNPAAPGDRTQDYKCEWCKCEDQIVKTKPTFQQETCGSFTSADCKTSVWAEWSTCSFNSGTCGIGTKTRMKKCSITITGGAEITQESFATTLYENFDADQKASLTHFAKLKSLTMGEYLYDHYCYTPNVKRLQQTKLATFKNDPNYYETGDCYTECKQKWGPWTSCSSNNGPGVQIRFDLNDHTIQDVQACDGRVPTGKSEAIYGPCSKTCGGGKKAKYQLDYAKITDFFNGLSTAVPTLTMEDCNMEDCPKLEFNGNYTCPTGGGAIPNDINLELTEPVTTTESTTTTAATTTTTTRPPIIVTSGASYTVVSTICLLLSMILAI